MCSTCPGVRQLKNSTRQLIPTQNRSFSGTRTICDVCWHVFEVCLFHIFIQVSNSKMWGQLTWVAWITVPSSRAACLRLLYFKPLLGNQHNDDGQQEWNEIFRISICLSFRRRPFRAKRWVRHIRSCCWENMVANLKAKITWNSSSWSFLKWTLELDTVWVEIVVVVVEEET